MTSIHLTAKDCGLLPAHQRDELLGWLRDLDVDPADVRDLTITHAEQSYELRLVVYARNEHGRMILNGLADEPATYPRTVRLGDQPTWPIWLGRSTS